MRTIDIRRFALAVGGTMALLYLGCVILMALAGREATIAFFNNILHGLDTAPIIRMEIPWWEMVMGIIETFILGWLIGALIASIYNFAWKPRG